MWITMTKAEIESSNEHARKFDKFVETLKSHNGFKKTHWGFRILNGFIKFKKIDYRKDAFFNKGGEDLFIDFGFETVASNRDLVELQAELRILKEKMKIMKKYVDKTASIFRKIDSMKNSLDIYKSQLSEMIPRVEDVYNKAIRGASEDK